ncbi:hypothetical protein [Archangium sp.]|uniref:hypothetical protein n=1 Tax=Archangium sp. TaxID=1872627 RepID=UPI00286B02C3|nr:hypothetical protein [Archangium sp.]
MKNRMWMVVTALGLAMSLVGCKSDCRTACEKKQECMSSGMDVAQCTTRCEQKAKEDKDFASQAQECSQCAKSRTCSETLKQCWDDCLTVVGI